MRHLLTTLRSIASAPPFVCLPATVAAIAMAAFLLPGRAPARFTAYAQQPAVPTPQQSVRPPLFGQPEAQNESTDRRMEETLEKGRLEERQKQLVRDTERLVELTQQLRDQVAKSNKNTLSVDIVKKAAEIEKLAKSVKERMRG